MQYISRRKAAANFAQKALMKTQEYKETPEMIAKLRAQLGLTQEQFAGKVGVTWSTVNRWENGRGKPSPLALGHLLRIARDAADIDKKIRGYFLNMRADK